MGRYLFQLALLAGAVLYALRRGGAPEKAVAGVLVAMLGVDLPMHLIIGSLGRYDTINLGHLLIDMGVFGALLVIALKADRIWTILATSAQLLAVVTHILRMTEVPMHPLVYAVLSRAPSYLLILLLFAGTWLHQRGRAREPESSARF